MLLDSFLGSGSFFGCLGFFLGSLGLGSGLVFGKLGLSGGFISFALGFVFSQLLGLCCGFLFLMDSLVDGVFLCALLKQFVEVGS